MPITEASNAVGLDGECSAAAMVLAPGRLKLPDVMPGTWPRKPRLGAVFGASREVPSSAVFLPQYFLFPLSLPLGQRYYIVKIRIRFLTSRLKKKDYFHVVIAA